jgi:WD40 repeat protein
MCIRKVLAAACVAALATGTSLGLPECYVSAASAAWQKPGDAKAGAAEILRLQSENSWFTVRACTADGKRLAWSGARVEKDGSNTILITVADRADRKVTPRVVAELAKKGSQGVTAATFSPDGTTLLVGFSEGQVLLVDAAGVKPPMVLENDPAKDVPWQRQPLVFSPDGKVVIGGADRYKTADRKSVEPREIAVWDAATGKVLRRFGGEWPNLEWDLLRVSGDGRTLLAQHWRLLKSAFDKKTGYTTWVEYTLRLWDYGTGKVRADSGKPLVIETTTAKRPAGPVLAQFPELAIGHGFGVRVWSSGKFVAFPRYPASPLEVSRRPGHVICVTDWATGKDLHSFTDFDNRSLLPFDWANGGNTVAANGGIGKQNALIV